MIIRCLRWPYSAFVVFCLLALALPLLSCGGPGNPKTVTVTPPTSSIAVRGQQNFTAVAEDAGSNVIYGATFSWTSSDKSIATVNPSGVATGVAPGTAMITAYSTNGNIASNQASLTVTPVIASITISPTTATIPAGGQQQFTATAVDITGTTVNATFTWQNSASSVASISSSGLVTGIAPGTALITASVGNVTSPVATLTVTP